MSDSEDDRQDKKRKAQFEDDAQFKKQKSLNSADDDESSDQDESEEDSDSGSDTEQAQQPRKQTNSAAAGEASGDDDDDDDDNDDDVDEDEEDDEDDEEDNDPDAKARKRIRARYFDEAAEEEDGGGAFEHDAKKREEEAYRRVRAENDAIRARREAAMSEREIAARYEERHQAEAHQREVIEALTEQDTSELRKQTSLPTPDGPKLWMIKCKEGKEKEIVVSIMNKAVATAGRGGRMGIMSAVNTAPGVVFVEAMSEIIVKDAVNGIQNLYAWRPKSIELTPIRQMVDVVTVRKEFDTFKRGQWVRMKRGVYKDDLAQVDDVRDGGAKLLLRAIPRINLARIGLTDADKKLKGRGPRPPQRMFDKRDIEAAGGEVESYPHFRGGLTRRGSAYRWQGDTYLKGFLYKEVKANTVDPNGRPPTLEDKQRFQMRRGAGSDTEDMGMDFDVGNAMGGGNVADILSGADVITAEQEMTLAPGDKVQVTEGALARLEGIVLEIKESTKTFLMKTTNFESDAPLEMPIHEVVKQFSTGDHVKIVGGKTQLGETGEVLVAGEDNESGIWKCTLLLDSGRQEVDVFNRDLKLSAEVVTSVGELDGYKLYDLVELGANEAGIIVHVGRTTLDVLTQQGEKRTIRPQQIKAQLNFRGRSMAMDADREKLAEGDVVKVVNGQHKGMEGTVKRVHSMYLFLHSNREMQNAGVFVARARQTKLAGANQRPKASVMGDIFSNPRPGGAGGAGRGRGRGRGVDPLMGKTVRVLARGVYKGLAGKVVALTDSTVDVELESRMKVVTIPRSRVKELGAAERASTGGTVPGYQAAGGGGGYGYGLGGMTPALGSQTPGLGSRTPGYAGSQTPGYAGSQTPGYAGSETPAHGGSSVWDSKTPLHNSITDNAWNTGAGGAYDGASHNSFSGIASSDMRMSSNMSLASTPGQSPMSDISRASGPALASGLCVKVTGGLHAGAIGYVKQHLSGGDSMCIVELADGRGITHEPKHNLVPTDVRVGDRVRSMTQTHEEGQVQSIQGDQVIVRLDVGGTKLLSTSQVMTVRPTH